MIKSKRKIQKEKPSAKRTKDTPKGQPKAAEYIGLLLELHKLQGILLVRLSNEV